MTDEGDGMLEIKRLAAAPTHQRKGYGRQMIGFVAETCQDRYCVLQVGTGDSPLTVPFSQKYGFAVSHRIENFLTEHYDHPIIECGVQLVDMVYLRKRLNG